MYLYQRLVRLYIRSNGTSSHVRLVTKNGISHIIVMRNLNIIKKNHVLQLRRIAYYCIGSDNYLSADKSAVANLRLRSDDYRPDNSCCRRNLGAFVNPDSLCRIHILIFRQGFSQLFHILPNMGQSLPGILKLLQQRFGHGVIQTVKILDFHF